MTTIRFPAQPARRGAARARTWWGKAWVRAVEEAAFGEADLRKARTLSRSGHIGAITLGTIGSDAEPGFLAAVEDADGMWAVSGRVPHLDVGDVEAFCEAVEVESGRIGALLAGDLPHALVEHVEEAGVELLPYGSELDTTCSCEFWLDPCPHGLAVLYQLAWLMDDDPFVLLHLVGLPRAELLARLDGRAAADDPAGEGGDTALETALDAALRAARMVELADAGDPIDHLL